MTGREKKMRRLATILNRPVIVHCSLKASLYTALKKGNPFKMGFERRCYFVLDFFPSRRMKQRGTILCSAPSFFPEGNTSATMNQRELAGAEK